MSELPLWGQLEKATDDDTTIEEYVAQAISDHNADTEAHLGTDESLKSHKSENVIDHPLGSVVADKLSITEDIYNTSFEDISVFSKFGDVQQNAPPGFQVRIVGGDETWVSQLASDQDPYTSYIDLSKNWMFQAFVYFEEDDVDFDIGIFNRSATPVYTGALFRRISGVTKGYFYGTSTTDETGTMTLDWSGFHTLRFQYDADDELLLFFIDGVQTGSIDMSSQASSGVIRFCFRLADPAEGSLEGFMTVRQMIISRQL